MLKPWIIALIGLIGLLALTAGARAAEVQDLRCEYRIDPLGIDVIRPRLSWIIASDRRGERQTACQVLVASSPERLRRHQGDIWDSGKVVTEQSVHFAYGGKPLRSQERCYWMARVWDRDGKPTEWSRPAFWSMGLLSPSDWRARWIGYDAAYAPPADAARADALLNTQGLKWVRFPQQRTKRGAPTFLRATFTLPADRAVRRAAVVLYADNYCEAAVNGVSIGQAMRWDRAARLDARSALQPGVNVLTLKATQSDFLPPAVIGKLAVQFDTGPDLVLPIDGSWKASQEETAGWQGRDFDDRGWPAAEAFDGTPWRGPAAVADVPRLPAPYLRRTFRVAQPVKRATVYVTALGAYELHLNGKRVGRDVLTPGWTEFRKRVLYQTYDVTRMVQRGENALGAILGDGWYASVLAHLGRRNIYGGKPRLLAQLVIELADGNTQVVATDENWKAAYGPIVHADLLMGCEYDARREMPGWDSTGFDAAAWSPVVAESSKPADGTGIQVQAAVAEPSRPLEELRTVRVTEPAPGCWTFDLGQNMVGWVRLKVRGAPGQRITVRHGEMLNPDGTIYTANLRSCPATDFYELAGKDHGKTAEVLQPYFTFHGFRYVEVRGLTAKPTPEMVTGIVVHTDMERTGAFACSSPLVNRLYHNIVWGNKGNYLEVPTDCPQRDERMGWTGDTQFFAPTAAYNYDVAPFFTRWLTICEDDQYPDGTFPHVVPDIMGGGGATAWGDAALLCTFNLYRAYGDTRVVAAHFAAMDRYMRWLDTKTRNGITRVGGFGDWLNLGGGADGVAIDTAYHAHLARLMATMAQAIGRTADARRYAAIHEECKAAFIREFVQPDGRLKGCSQTGYALAFTMDLLPANRREQAAAKFVEEIKRFNWHLATGFIGTPRLLPGLDEAGRNDVAYRLLLQETYPSWLFPVTLGATTMWERWNGWTPTEGFGDISMNSFNHYAFGAVGEYLYGSIGGIAPRTPGYKAIVIRPVVQYGLTWARTAFASVYGRIATSWKVGGGNLTLDVTIPPNTTATVTVPTADARRITESGIPAAHAPGVRLLRMEKSGAVFAVEAGIYRFSTPFHALLNARSL